MKQIKLYVQTELGGHYRVYKKGGKWRLEGLYLIAHRNRWKLLLESAHYYKPIKMALSKIGYAPKRKRATK